MKNSLLFAVALILSVASLQAQYKIDLSSVTPPALEYLKMGNEGPKGKEIRINNLYMEEAGKPLLPVAGEFNYSRMDHRYWRDALLKMKASGINIVSTYCLWALHEEVEGELSWEGRLNLRHFVQLCGELGLKVHLRIGPYCNAEIIYGALPAWLANNKNLEIRSNDPLYLSYVNRWYRALYEQVKGLLYKDGGPVIAIQLENEYVRKGMVIPHLLKLKEMAVKAGFDVPLYSMTHWMSTEYPKGEIVPYAGYYLETPWIFTGRKELPVSNVEYFSYNRISNNIGNDIIKTDGKVESLGGKNNDSPYFTCEIGVGSVTGYRRRPVVPETMAGENINLRLGCGVNLMGYYMYVGGSNPVGKVTTFQSPGVPRVNYDYQAPIREFGQMGRVMPETKKYNFFMNDFGSELAPAVAYLPTSNQDTGNLQWAVRANGNSGYLFCSNSLYKHSRRDYRNVQFKLCLKGETLRIPRNKVTVRDSTYFMWPFNQVFSGVSLKYATVQPICYLAEGNTHTYFFFEDDHIAGEYLLSGRGIKNISVEGGRCRSEKNAYFVDALIPGKQCAVNIEKNDGTKVRFVTLTEKESDLLWKGSFRGHGFVALSDAAPVCDRDKMTLISETPVADMWMYENGTFVRQTFRDSTRKNLELAFRPLSPLGKAQWVAPQNGNVVQRTFAIRSLSTVERAYLRYSASKPAEISINGKSVTSKALNGYHMAVITSVLAVADNHIRISLPQPSEGIAAEIEILMRNGERILWSTDATWTSENGSQPLRVLSGKDLPAVYDALEHTAVYEVDVPAADRDGCETRMSVAYEGDVADAYLNGKLVGDSFYDGSLWTLSLSRMQEEFQVNPLVIRIDGLKSGDEQIYFEKNVHPENCIVPTIKSINVNKECRFTVK